MSLRFQKRKKVVPGTSVNLSKSSASVGTGIRGARISLGLRGVRGSVGLPGTGISLSGLGLRRMGGFGAVIGVFVLLSVMLFRLVWALLTLSLRASVWVIRESGRLMVLAIPAIQHPQVPRQRLKSKAAGNLRKIQQSKRK